MTAARKLRAETFGEQFAEWFDDLPEDERRQYEQLAEAGRLYRGDVEAERVALRERTHPTQRG